MADWVWLGGCDRLVVTGWLVVTYPADVIGVLPQGLEDVEGGGQVHVLEVVYCVCICSWKLLLTNILNHLSLKLCMHWAWLDHGHAGGGGGGTRVKEIRRRLEGLDKPEAVDRGMLVSVGAGAGHAGKGR